MSNPQIIIDNTFLSDWFNINKDAQGVPNTGYTQAQVDEAAARFRKLISDLSVNNDVIITDGVNYEATTGNSFRAEVGRALSQNSFGGAEIVTTQEFTNWDNAGRPTNQIPNLGDRTITEVYNSNVNTGISTKVVTDDGNLVSQLGNDAVKTPQFINEGLDAGHIKPSEFHSFRSNFQTGNGQGFYTNGDLQTKTTSQAIDDIRTAFNSGDEVARAAASVEAAKLARYGKVLKGAGIVGTVIDVFASTNDIIDRLENNDYDGAMQVAAEFAGREIGAWAGGAVLFALGLALGLTAAPLLLGLGLIGGILGAMAGESIADMIFNQFRPDAGSVPIDPFVLDLDGDGVELLGVATANVFFDIDGDNFNERVGWVSADDGLLVRDLNNNGTIDGISELIGTASQDAYTVLRGLDDNSDGKIDSQDTVWGTLKVWRDLDSDGVTDTGELQTLDSLLITEFSLSNSTVEKTFLGNFVHSEATYTINGASLQTRAVFFGVQQNQTQFTAPSGYVPDADVIKLPELVGGGSVTPLSYSMTNNSALKTQVTVLIQGAGSMSLAALRSAVEAIMFKWAGVEAVVAGSRGSHIDAKHVAVLEQFGGSTFPDLSVNSGAAVNLEAQYQTLLTQYTLRFAIQSYGSFAALNYDGTDPSILEGHNYQHLAQVYVNSADESISLNSVTLLDSLVAKINTLAGDPVDLIESGDLSDDVYITLEVLKGLVGQDLSILASEPGVIGNTGNSLDLDIKYLLLNLGANGAATNIGFGDGSANTWTSVGQDLSYYGAAGADTLTGNSDDNLLLGGEGDDHLVGGWDHDTLVGGGGNDELDIGAENYLNWGQRDADALIGGTGNDSYVVNDIDDVIIEYADEGVDTVYTGIEYTLADNVENLVLEGIFAKGTGNALDNTITGDENDNYLNGGAGADTLIGGGGSDTYVIDNIGDVIVDTNENLNSSILTNLQDYELGLDFLTLGLIGTANLNASGNDRDNAITGNIGNNTLDGREGNDSLDGGGGIDTLIGGLGDDSYFVRTSADTIVEYADEGYDEVNSLVSFTLSDNVESLRLFGDGDIDATGNSGNNFLQGNFGDNIITGGAGNDLLGGNGGIDVLIGGSGDDTYSLTNYDNQVATIVENANEGVDLVWAYQNYTLGDNLENVTIVASGDFDATGNALDNHLIGNSDANTLTGGLGNDTLDGGMGTDQLIGGDGDDRYIINDNADTIVEASGGGQDTVVASTNFTLAEHLENLTLEGGSDINGTGNDAANVIVGSSGNNILTGGASNDTLSGEWGADRLEGGTGNDTLDGGAGGDTAVFTGGFADYAIVRNLDGSILVTDLVGTDGADLLTKVEGAYFAGDDVTVNLAQLLAVSGTVNDDVIYGTAGNDELRGLEGDDTLIGGEGGDYLLGGAGDDQVNFDGALADYTFRRQANGQVTVDNLLGDTTTLDSIEAVYFEGSQSWMSMTSVVGAYGTSGSDAWLAGTVRNDALYGLDGDDTLIGREGNDFIDGGDGDDQANYVGNLSDFSFYRESDGSISVVDATGIEGVDRLVNIESVYFDGSQNWRLLSDLVADYGTQGDDAWLEGTAGNDLLMGLAGDDTLIGREGDDTIDGGEGSDQANYIGNRSDFFIYSAANNTYYVTDLVGSEGTDYLQNVESVYFDGSSTWIDLANYYNDFSGSSGNDILEADDGKDHLYGLEGDDSLWGKGGNDILDGGDGTDEAVYAGSFTDYTFSQNLDGSVTVTDLVWGQGQDRLVDIENVYFMDANARLSVENALAISNNQPLNFYGSSFMDWLEGSQWTDNIYGYGDDDILFGYGADDNIIGGDGNDSARYMGASTGYDVVLNLDGTVTVTDLVGDEGTDTLDGVEEIYFYSDGQTIYVGDLTPPGARMAMTSSGVNVGEAAGSEDGALTQAAARDEVSLEAYAQVSISKFISADLYSSASIMRDATNSSGFGRTPIADILDGASARTKFVKTPPSLVSDLQNAPADIEQIRLKMVDAMARFAPAESSDIQLPHQPSLFRPEFASIAASFYRSASL